MENWALVDRTRIYVVFTYDELVNVTARFEILPDACDFVESTGFTMLPGACCTIVEE